MKNIVRTVITAVALAAILASPMQAQDSGSMTIDKVIEMSNSGLSSETIINAIISSGGEYNLSADDVLRLNEAGVDEDVINFMLRTRPISSSESQESDAMEPGQPEQPGEPGDATSQPAYYEGSSYLDDQPYEYTDGYNYENERTSTIIYHYYGPWFRAYPYYYGFYYYPASYYYWCYWPDDYYYYFYYPRFTTWRYYYYYPRGYWGGSRYYYSGGRYVKVKGGRYIDRTVNDGYRYRDPYRSTRVRSTSVSSGDRRVRSSGYTTRSAYGKGSISNPGTRTTYRTRSAVPRGSEIKSRSSSQYRSRSSISRSKIYSGSSSRSRGKTYSYSRPSSKSYSSRSAAEPRRKSSTVRSSRSSGSSRSYSSGSRSSSSKSSSSRSAVRKRK